MTSGGDWLLNLKFECQTTGKKRDVACNPVDVEHICAAVAAAGLSDLVTVQPSYVIPPGHAWVAGTTGLDEDFYRALQIRRYL